MKKSTLVFILSSLCTVATAQNCSVSLSKFQSSGECEGMSIQLMAYPFVQSSSYSWNCPNSANNSTSGPFLFIPYAGLADSGIYTLTVTDTSGCVASNTISVNVIPKPLVYITGQNFACYGTKTPLFADDFSGNYGPYQYLWENGMTTHSILISHYGGVGPHPSCTITNASGCSASNQTAFLIGTIYPPEATISFSGLSSFCAPGNLELNCTTYPSLNMTYRWKKNGRTIAGSTNSACIVTTTGNYKVIVTDYNGCADTSDAVPVTVYARPAATILADGPLTFCQGDSVILSGSAGAGYAYQWRRNGVPVAGATQVSFKATEAGNYKVAVTTDHDCYRLSNKAAVAIDCRSANDVLDQSLSEFTVFPNPTQDGFRISFSDKSDKQVTIRIFDVIGKEVFRITTVERDEDIWFGTGLMPGIYMAQIQNLTGIRVARLIKK